MARTFFVLAIGAVLLLAATFLIGLMGGDFHAAVKQKLEARAIDAQRESPEASADAHFDKARSWMSIHMLLGAAAALVAVLINSITITYFIGTSRWCREVCETYEIKGDLAERSTRLKRNTFPWALAGIISVIVVVGLGAAADPTGANFRNSASFVTPHFLAAMIGLAVVMAALAMQISRIADNHAVIEELLAEVKRIRAARNLPIEATSNS